MASKPRGTKARYVNTFLYMMLSGKGTKIIENKLRKTMPISKTKKWMYFENVL